MIHVVIGASRGIGLECVKQSLSLGNIIYATYRNKPNVTHDALHWLECDLTKKSSTDYFLSELKHLSHIDSLIICAGNNNIKSISDYTDDEVDYLFRLNLISHFTLIRSLLPKLMLSDSPRIVGVSSIWGTVGVKYRSLYTATKGGMDALYRSLAVEFAPKILINTVSPGFTATELTLRSLGYEGISKLEKFIPVKRLADPKEIANHILYLASPENSYVTGQNAIIDGGFSVSAKCL